MRFSKTGAKWVRENLPQKGVYVRSEIVRRAMLVARGRDGRTITAKDLARADAWLEDPESPPPDGQDGDYGPLIVVSIEDAENYEVVEDIMDEPVYCRRCHDTGLLICSVCKGTGQTWDGNDCPHCYGGQAPCVCQLPDGFGEATHKNTGLT